MTDKERDKIRAMLAASQNYSMANYDPDFFTRHF